jgi:hypothetical protein
LSITDGFMQGIPVDASSGPKTVNLPGPRESWLHLWFVFHLKLRPCFLCD